MDINTRAAEFMASLQRLSTKTEHAQGYMADYMIGFETCLQVVRTSANIWFKEELEAAARAESGDHHA